VSQKFPVLLVRLIPASEYKAVACAIVASGISTFAGYPVSLHTYREERLRNRTDLLNQLDSLKSRLQTIKHPISVPSLAVLVYREEGVRGFYRGLWIPLVTITFVSMSLLFLFIRQFRRLTTSRGAASFTIYSGTKETFRDARLLNRDTLLDVSLLGGIGSDPDRPPEPQNANIRLQGRVGGIGHLVWVSPIRTCQGPVIVLFH